MQEIKNEFSEKKNLLEIEKADEIKMWSPADISMDKANDIYRRVIEEKNDGKNCANDVKEIVFYGSLNEMKCALGKTYGEIKADKPLNSPNLSKWFEHGGNVAIEARDGQNIWMYRDSTGKEVAYIDGYPVFPPESKHPIIQDINIGRFTGDRMEDKRIYLERLEEEYGLTDIPDGYNLHHGTINGEMQLIKEEYHKKFTHSGGHSLYRGQNHADFKK